MHLLLLAAAAADAGSGEISFGAALKANPYFLIGNMITSGIVLTFVVERTVFQLTRYRVNSKEFFAQVKKLVAAGNIDRAIKLCEASDYPIRPCPSASPSSSPSWRSAWVPCGPWRTSPPSSACWAPCRV
jgi:hypothetical protein